MESKSAIKIQDDHTCTSSASLPEAGDIAHDGAWFDTITITQNNVLPYFFVTYMKRTAQRSDHMFLL